MNACVQNKDFKTDKNAIQNKLNPKGKIDEYATKISCMFLGLLLVLNYQINNVL